MGWDEILSWFEEAGAMVREDQAEMDRGSR